MRQSTAALALIELAGEPPRWLVQWNEGWQAYSLVGGHRHADESFRECLCREVVEELHLADETEFRVGLYPVARAAYRAFSHRAQEETEYRLELFAVELLGDATARVSADTANRWVTRGEITAQRADDGRQISDQVRRLLDAQLGHEREFEMQEASCAIVNPRSEIPIPRLETVMPYTPKPIDTSRVTLSPEIGELTERLAENAHDHWAAQRLSQGWTYGPARDDPQKKHPCLVAYAELPDSEKQYDRLAAMETLKAIMALGYRIEKP